VREKKKLEGKVRGGGAQGGIQAVASWGWGTKIIFVLNKQET
jgi:hypothetical protein